MYEKCVPGPGRVSAVSEREHLDVNLIADQLLAAPGSWSWSVRHCHLSLQHCTLVISACHPHTLSLHVQAWRYHDVRSNFIHLDHRS